MFGFGSKALMRIDHAGQVTAINRSQAVIEFNLDGTIITANQNFLDALGYTLLEIQGKHHSMFVEPGFRTSAEYRTFWDNLNRGQFQRAEYKRLGKGGREVWIQASYNPILDAKGRPFKVVKCKRYERTLLPESGSVPEIARGLMGHGGYDGGRCQASSQA